MKPTTFLTSVSALLLTTTIGASQAIAQSYDNWVFVAQQRDGLKFYVEQGSISGNNTRRFNLREDATESYNYNFSVRDIEAEVNCNDLRRGVTYKQFKEYKPNSVVRTYNQEQHEILPGSATQEVVMTVCSI